LVEWQWLWREHRGLTIRLKRAQLKVSGSLEDLDCRSSRGLPQALIEQLPASPWRMFTLAQDIPRMNPAGCVTAE
jgi:hypothetical protein